MGGAKVGAKPLVASGEERGYALKLIESRAGRLGLSQARSRDKISLDPPEQQANVLADAGEDGIDAVAAPAPLRKLRPSRPSSFMWPITGSICRISVVRADLPADRRIGAPSPRPRSQTASRHR
jgi:hypothetical protein